MSLTPQANWFAFVALLAWPAVALLFFKARPVNKALTWTILGGYLLLPVGTSMKFEGIPAFDKSSIPSLAALVGTVLIARRSLRLFHGFGLAEALIVALVVGPFVTSSLNGDPVRIGSQILPGVGAYDALSAVVTQLIFLLPFFLARQLLRDAESNVEVLRVLVIAGLLYSVPALFEVRMSPQLHAWIYGYFPHSFEQQMRDGGFRPVVFLGHGLLVAFFIMTTAVATAAFWQTRSRLFRLPAAGITAYLGGVLFLCKSLGAFLYGAVLVPLVRFTRPQLQVLVACALMSIALLYPVLRITDVVPTTFMVELAHSVSAERAESLKVRFDNEDQLLERASQRLFFGWGRFGRNRIYDDETGKDISVTDGRWIQTLGQFGFIGFLAEFGLLALAVARAAAALKFASDASERVFLSALALIVAINMVNLLPNSGLSPWAWLLTGTLLGRSEMLRALARQRRPRLGTRPEMARN